MKRIKKLFSVLLAAVLALSMVNVSYAVSADTSFFTDISENFDNQDLVAGSRYSASSAWLRFNNNSDTATYDSYVASNGILGRTAEATDYSLKLNNNNISSNWFMFIPNRYDSTTKKAIPGKTWGYYEGSYPAGMAMETSFDFAIEKFAACNDGYLAFSINDAGTAQTNSVKSRIQVKIERNNGAITVTTGTSTTHETLIPAVELDAWHSMKFVVVFDEGTYSEETAVNSGKARASIYLDDELMCSISDFDWAGTTKGSDGWQYKTKQKDNNTSALCWDNNSIWHVLFTNMTKATKITTGQRSANLYVDNFKMGQVDYTELNNAIAEVEAELDAYGADYGALQVAAVQAKINEAKAYIAQTGTLLSQAAVTEKANELLDALTELENGTVTLWDDIFIDFNDAELGSHSVIGAHNSGKPIWASPKSDVDTVVQSSEIDSTAAADDYSIALTGSGSYYTRFFPSRAGWGELNDEAYLDGIPAGTVVETSMKFANGNTATSGTLHIGLNMVGSVDINTNATPFLMNMSDGYNKIESIQYNDQRITVDKSIMDDEGNPKWMDLKIITVYTEENSCTTAENPSTNDDADADPKKGYASVYLDGELLCEPYEFTYVGSSAGAHSSWKYKDGVVNGNSSSMEWDNDGIWNVYFRAKDNAGPLYIDDVRMHVVTEKKVQLKKAIDKANALLAAAEAGTTLGKYNQADLDALEAKIADAYTIYNNKTTDAEGNITEGAVYTLYTQDTIDTTLTALTTAVDELPSKAVSEKLEISKSGNTVNAVFTKRMFADGSFPAKVIVAVFDNNDKLLGVEVDNGDGTIDFTGVGTDGEDKTLSASIDISTMTGAYEARAFVWNSLTGMEPIVSFEPLPLSTN